MGSLFGRKAARNCSQLFFSRSFSSQLFVSSSEKQIVLPGFALLVSLLIVFPVTIDEFIRSRLSFYTTEEELGKAFSPFGKVIEARLVQDHKAKRHKGFGFVTFESENHAQKALKAMNNRIFRGRLIFVEVAKSTSEQETTMDKGE